MTRPRSDGCPGVGRRGLVKFHAWRPKHQTRFGAHLDRSPVVSMLVVSLRWLMIRVIW